MPTSLPVPSPLSLPVTVQYPAAHNSRVDLTRTDPELPLGDHFLFRMRDFRINSFVSGLKGLVINYGKGAKKGRGGRKVYPVLMGGGGVANVFWTGTETRKFYRNMRFFTSTYFLT